MFLFMLLRVNACGIFSPKNIIPNWFLGLVSLSFIFFSLIIIFPNFLIYIASGNTQQNVPSVLKAGALPGKNGT